VSAGLIKVMKDKWIQSIIDFDLASAKYAVYIFFHVKLNTRIAELYRVKLAI